MVDLSNAAIRSTATQTVRCGGFLWLKPVDGIRQDVKESLNSAVRYSIPLDPRCFRWKMLSLSGPKARMLLQLLIPLVTWFVLNVTAEVKDLPLISLDTNRVSREEVCLLSFEVVNCRLK